MSDLLNRQEALPADEFGRYRIALDATEVYWSGAGFSKDAKGFTRTSISVSPRDLIPRAHAVAGGPDNTVFLQPACAAVCKAAYIANPHERQDWRYVARWLDLGIPIAVICKAVRAQCDRMGDKYQGCSTLRLFEGSVLNTWAREKGR